MRAHTRTLAVVAALVAGVAAARSQSSAEPPRTLSGVVRDAAGKPIAGARVTIQNALVERAGTVAQIDSDDIDRDTLTDDAGRFELAALTGDIYELSVLAASHRPAWVADARTAGTIDVRLRELEPNPNPRQRIRIKVVDETERPVPAARIRVEAVYDIRSRGRSDKKELVEQFGVADDDGEIELRTTLPMVGISGWVSAGGYVSELATAYSGDVPGREGFETADEKGEFFLVQLARGSSATGSVWSKPADGSDGKPLAGVVVEIARTNSNPPYLDRTRTLTGPDGRFDLPRVAPFMNFKLCAVLGQPGATPVTDFTVNPESLDTARVLDVGVLLSGPSATVSGRLVFDDSGAAPPAGTTIRIRRSRGGDFVDTTTDARGGFKFSGIPEGTAVEILIPTPGLILAGGQRAFEVSSDAIVGLVDSAVADLTLFVRHGKRPPLGALPREVAAELRMIRDELETVPLGSPPPAFNAP